MTRFENIMSSISNIERKLGYKIISNQSYFVNSLAWGCLLLFTLWLDHDIAVQNYTYGIIIVIIFIKLLNFFSAFCFGRCFLTAIYLKGTVIDLCASCGRPVNTFTRRTVPEGYYSEMDLVVLDEENRVYTHGECLYNGRQILNDRIKKDKAMRAKYTSGIRSYRMLKDRNPLEVEPPPPPSRRE